MHSRGYFQLAVRDPNLHEQLRKVLMLYSTVRLTRDARDVFPSVEDPQRCAGVLAEYAPGFEDWLAAVRLRAPALPVLVLVERFDARLSNQLHAQGAELSVRPLHPPQVLAFVQRALASDCLPHDRVARMVAHLAEARGLTAREVQLVSYCLGDMPRAQVRRRLGISENTLKTQVRALLRKCGERNVDSLAKNLLRAAVLGDLGALSARPVTQWLAPCEAVPGAA